MADNVSQCLIRYFSEQWTGLSIDFCVGIGQYGYTKGVPVQKEDGKTNFLSNLLGNTVPDVKRRLVHWELKKSWNVVTPMILCRSG